MPQELIYTSARKGLKLGSSGFCTVASTPGMATNLANQLENLSGYRHLFDPGNPSNPPVLSHLTTKIGGSEYSILSRVGDAGLDYSKRSNKLAHHVAIQKNERTATAPSTLLGSEFFASAWEGEARALPPRSLFPLPELQPATCQTWKNVFGDAGWAGAIIDAKKQGKVSSIIFEPGTDVLSLISEALAILPPHQQWDFSFSTFFTKIPPRVNCDWRFIPAGTPEASAARRSRNTLYIDASTQQAGTATKYVEAARSGNRLAFEKPVFEAPQLDPRKGKPKFRPAAMPPAAGSLELNESNLMEPPTLRGNPPGGFTGPTSQPPELNPVGPPENFPPAERRRRVSWLVIALSLALLIGLPTIFLAGMFWDKLIGDPQVAQNENPAGSEKDDQKKPGKDEPVKTNPPKKEGGNEDSEAEPKKPKEPKTPSAADEKGSAEKGSTAKSGEGKKDTSGTEKKEEAEKKEPAKKASVEKAANRPAPVVNKIQRFSENSNQLNFEIDIQGDTQISFTIDVPKNSDSITYKVNPKPDADDAWDIKKDNTIDLKKFGTIEKTKNKFVIKTLDNEKYSHNNAVTKKARKEPFFSGQISIHTKIASTQESKTTQVEPISIADVERLESESHPFPCKLDSKRTRDGFTQQIVWNSLSLKFTLPEELPSKSEWTYSLKAKSHSIPSSPEGRNILNLYTAEWLNMKFKDARAKGNIIQSLKRRIDALDGQIKKFDAKDKKDQNETERLQIANKRREKIGKEMELTQKEKSFDQQTKDLVESLNELEIEISVDVKNKLKTRFIIPINVTPANKNLVKEQCEKYKKGSSYKLKELNNTLKKNRPKKK